MPALGFAMGDVVLGELMNETAHVRQKAEDSIANNRRVDIYVVIAKEQRRADALAQIQQFRDRGFRVDYPLASEKVGKQFQTAEQLGARFAVLFGDEWPQVKIKALATREELLIDNHELQSHIERALSQPS
jgi:histidyl-tRNA synthetase